MFCVEQNEQRGSPKQQQVVEKHDEAHHQRGLEAFASFFIGFIRAQTEDSSKLAPPRCDTPRKVSVGNVLQLNPSAQQRKLSISDGSCYPMSGIPGAATPAAEGHATNRPGELDTTGTPPVNLIARQLFDHHGGLSGVCESDPKSPGNFRTLETLAIEDGELAGAIGYSTPKRFPPQFGAVDGQSTPGTNDNQSLSRCKNTNDAGFATPPRTNNVSRSGGAGSMLLSFTSTPIAGSRGKTATAHHGSSRNGSLEVSCPSPSTPGNGTQRQEPSGLSDGGGGTIGRRRKSSLPCLGDYIVTHATKPHRNRRSPFTNNNSGSNNEPGGLHSSNALNSSSPMFQDDDFPQLNVTPNKDQTGNDDNGQGAKKRVSLNAKTSLNDSQDGSLSGVAGGRKAGHQRRRIAPTTVSRTVSGRHDFNSSSVRSENNLIAIESHEDANPDPRGMLRSLKEEIRSDFLRAEKAQLQRTTVRAKQSLQASFGQVDSVIPVAELDTSSASDVVQNEGEKALKAILIIEFDKVTHKPTIDRLVTIYALLMDLNLVPNMLNELAYLINLVSTERYIAPVPQRQPETTSALADNAPAELSGVLRSPHNCVYFATEVLYHQRTLLALLDSTSLRVVVENEQLGALHPPLNGFLRDMLAQKMKLENPFINPASSGGDLLLLNNSITNVFYQQENDTKDHFPSSKEFSAFNKQRDLFYAALRVWETEHLNPTWEFEAKLGSKVRAMLDILNHPINMSHLAKLFSAQLIISFNFDNSASELQMALPNIDLTKLSKLRQRLVGPSIFSTQYLFPGSQMFFRDFIVATENHQMFIEQLKAVLIHELLQMNGSTYELFNICGVESTTRSEYVVRPETIATMRVLAKFIGFIIARPFQYEGCRNTIVENRQIELRNMLLPPFDVQPVLLRSVAEHKLVITVPWLVQYLSMLDLVTLRLRYYEELFRMLHDIYKATSMCSLAVDRDLFVVPTSRFIVRCCLDWLFEQSNVPEEYYNASEMCVSSAITNIVAKRTAPSEHAASSGKHPIAFNPLLENILSAACPFLADFRVSVMPSKVEKTVSRTGRYRHITTRVVTQHQPSAVNELTTALDLSSLNISSASAGHNRSKPSHGNVQQRLVEGFLQSQSQSLRRTVELIVDRSTSAVIKDFQMMFILPEKKTVSDGIAAVSATDLEGTKRRIQSICDEALDRINNTWESHVPKMLNKRITESFDALLPAETLDPVRKLCRNITLERCLQKSSEWRQAYMSITGLFCKDVEGEAQSLIHKHLHQQQQANKTLSTNANQTEFSVAENCAIMPSGLYVKLQLLVHRASSSPDKLAAGELYEFIAQSYDFLEQPGLTTTPMMDRILAFMLLQLILLLIKSRYDLSVPELFQRTVKIWKHKKLARFCLPPPPEPEESPGGGDESLAAHERSLVYPAEIELYRRRQMQRDANYVFSHLVSKRFIRMLEATAAPTPHYEAYAELITVLLEADVITKDLLNDQFVTLFREDWPPSTLDRVSVVIKRVLQKGGPASRHGRHNIDDSHSEMFMEMLSDFARDITDL